jgi:AGZA family xanthine/uracil permease-like MFS transporter
MSFVVEAIPDAVITPILLFVGIEIVSQAFLESPRRHVPAVTFAIVPTVGYLVLAYADTLIGKLDPTVILPAALTADLNILRAVGHGFILTAILWGGLLAHLIDGKLRRASIGFFLCAAFAMFGVIHSVTPSGEIYFPWSNGSSLIWQITLGYTIVGAALLIGSFRSKAT